MRNLVTTTTFMKDLKRVKKRGKNPDKLRDILDNLLANELLERKFKPHRLAGNMAPYWECHIESDWLLIWEENDDTLTLIRTGTHSDLFR